MNGLFKLIKAFFKIINVTRLLLINTLFIAILFVLYLAFTTQEAPVQIANNSILQLNFNGVIVEQRQPIDFSGQLSKQMLSNDQQVTEYPVEEILQVIEYAKNDNKIDKILLDLSGLQSASLNQIYTIGKALNNFKESNKEVIATADNYSQIQYLLASYANDIYLDPQGLVYLQGFSVYRLYFKELLDNLLITPHIFKVGTYKSFVEPFTETKMSEASKLANSHWLDQLWQGYIDTVIEQRQHTNISQQSISPTLEQLKVSLQESNADSALYAQKVGLVDHLLPRYKVLDLVENTKHKWISYERYQSTLPMLYQSRTETQQIALIHGQGEILNGKQTSQVIGGDSFSELLDKALKNDQIKAVVIRLDTPGGSAFASEKIRQHILDLKQAGKKVVVSMAATSASGGYWIASAADKIVAAPSTLTGSIGIFGMFASADKALNKIGVYNDGVGTTPLSLINPARSLPPELAEIMQMGIERGYQQFLKVVSEGRKMTLEEVNKVAQGRVWTGVDAKSLGLVDELGDLQDAINIAASLSAIESYDIVPITATISAKQQLINDILSNGVKMLPISIKSSFLDNFLAIQNQVSIVTDFNDPKGHYLYCPMCFINY